MLIPGQRIYRSRVNYSEMEVSDEYDRFPLTSVKMEELLSMAGPFLHQETNCSCVLSEKQLLKIALHWLGIQGQYHSTGDMLVISKTSVWTAYFHLLIIQENTTGCIRIKLYVFLFSPQT